MCHCAVSKSILAFILSAASTPSPATDVANTIQQQKVPKRHLYRQPVTKCVKEIHITGIKVLRFKHTYTTVGISIIRPLDTITCLVGKSFLFCGDLRHPISLNYIYSIIFNLFNWFSIPLLVIYRHHCDPVSEAPAREYLPTYAPK